MTRFAKVYESYKKNKKEKNKNIENKILNREGYGYIKRRVGLLSNEVGKPTYLVESEST